MLPQSGRALKRHRSPRERFEGSAPRRRPRRGACGGTLFRGVPMDRPLVYGADWCGLTRGFRNYLDTLGIDYQYLNVESDAFAAEAVRTMNGGKLKFPMIVVGVHVMKNPPLRELNAALDATDLLHALEHRGLRTR